MNQPAASRGANVTDAIADTSDLPSTAAAREATVDKPQPWWRLMAYGGLSMPLYLAAAPILTYLPAFYTKELHLSAGLVGLVFLSVRLWDGLADILSGWFSDRSRCRLGRRKPWVVCGAVLLMASTWFLCNPPQGVGPIYLAVWAALFYTTWTGIYVPYVSWGTELASDYDERTRVTSVRETFSMLGSLFFATGPLILLADDAPFREVLSLISLTVTGLLMVSILPVALFVRDPLPAQRVETHLLAGLFTVIKDRVLIRLALVTLLTHISNGVNNSLLVFAFSTGLDLPNKVFLVIFIIYVCSLGALPVVLRLAKHVEKHHLHAIGFTIQVVTYAAHLWIPSGNFPIVALLWALNGIGTAAVVALPTSILADTIDHGEATRGVRCSGTYVAVFNLVYKIGLGLGVGLAFGLLELFRFDPNAAVHGPDQIYLIRVLGFGLPALLLLPAIVLIWKHPITRNVQRQLRAQIEARNAA